MNSSVILGEELYTITLKGEYWLSVISALDHANNTFDTIVLSKLLEQMTKQGDD